jgi:4-hydroxy-4-methyl-2-oxoglutarate aldolase
MPKPTLEEIRKVFLKGSTAMVGDVIRAMGNPAIVCDPEIKSAKLGTRFCGQAYTLQYRPFRKGDKSEDRKIIEMKKTQGVIVLATYPSIRDEGYWGDNMNSQARAMGAIARVTDGLTRDVKEHVDTDFPLFFRGAASGPVWGLTKPISSVAQVPVVFGGVRCEPGDIVMGDDDGVIIIPLAEAEKSLSQVEWKIEFEERMGKASKAGDFKARAVLVVEQQEHMKKLKDL